MLAGSVSRRCCLVMAVATGVAAGLAWAQPIEPDDEAASATRTAAEAPKNLAYSRKTVPGIETTTLGPRRFRVIDVHEHVVDAYHAERLLAAMDRFGIERTCLMGSSWYTFTLNPRFGFERWEQNNERLLAIRREHPDRFCVFVTLDPEAFDALARLQQYVAKGADGVKLYLGHGGQHGKGPFHVMPLDDPRLRPLFAWLEQTQLPITLHVNLIKYRDEFVRLMDAFPELRVNVPHFGLHKNTAKRLARLEALLERYPNLYTDVSFGWHQFHLEGFEALAKWRTRSRDWLTRNRDKVMFASDMVLEQSKDDAYIDDTLRSYFQLLESRKFRFFMEPRWLMHGLALDDETLRAIYETTPRRFLRMDGAATAPGRAEGG
ncbi:MAG: amidohydrolase family protein [Myxococcota bacterium]|nr:amidohydrolase family protein [Myxococcota bacterium]